MRKKSAALAATMLVASGLTAAAAAPAAAAATEPCGEAGNYTQRIVQVGSYYKTKTTAALGTTRVVAADVYWGPPVVGAPLQWYVGALAQGIAYSPGVSTINYPAKMRGFISYSSDSCQTTHLATS